MFNKRDREEEVTLSSTEKSIETIIGEGTEFEGTITSRTALRVDGVVKGDSTGPVIIGASGEVSGTITTKQIFIAGTINGNVVIEDRTEFVSGGYLHGDLITGDLIIEKGASFDGNCKTKNAVNGKLKENNAHSQKNEPKTEQKTDPKI
ncbi:MAG: polymer-forming cytoskeletal protein [Oscillospiraceae bacterium]